MKIDKICINNFGKISNLTICPKDGLNVIYAPNESGKSTLLAFVKFIFYGTKIKRKKGEMSFKEKFMPWNMMPMSGSIELTYDDKKYIIYRMEGTGNGMKKLEVKELLTGAELNIQHPGRHFFSVGEKAFSDSCYVTDIFSVTEVDDDILSMFSDQTHENSSYMKVKNDLEEKILSLSSPKRTSSQLSILTSKLSEEQKNILNTTNSLSETKQKVKQLKLKEDALKTKLSNLEKESHDASDASLFSQYEQMMCEKEREEENLKILANDLLSLTGNKTQSNAKNKKVIFLFSALFFVFAIVSYFMKVNVAVSVILLSLAFLGMVFSLRDNKNTQRTHNSVSLISSLKRQIEISRTRYDEIVNKLNDFKEKYPHIEKNHNFDDLKRNNFTTDEINDIILKKEECLDELRGVNIELSSLCKNEADLSQRIESYNNAIRLIENQIDEVNSRLEIYRIVLLILESAFAKVRDEFAPRLCLDAQKLLSRVSSDSFEDLVTNENFETSVRINNEYKNVSCLSKGTQALVYLSLRLSISLRMSDESIPVFLDDVLATFDDDRCAKMMNALGEFSKTKQIFLCTCRKREAHDFVNEKSASLIFLERDD